MQSDSKHRAGPVTALHRPVGPVNQLEALRRVQLVSEEMKAGSFSESQIQLNKTDLSLPLNSGSCCDSELCLTFILLLK